VLMIGLPSKSELEVHSARGVRCAGLIVVTGKELPIAFLITARGRSSGAVHLQNFILPAAVS
jgi:hypothetical protein